MPLFEQHETDLLLAELDDRQQEAWATYATAIRDLEGSQYERAERDQWATLQAALRAIEADRLDLLDAVAA